MSQQQEGMSEGASADRIDERETELLVDELGDIVRFLSGEMPFRGVWFGEKPKGEKGRYWWRAHLFSTYQRVASALEDAVRRELYANATAESQPQAAHLRKRAVEGEPEEEPQHENNGITPSVILPLTEDRVRAIVREEMERCL